MRKDGILSRVVIGLTGLAGAGSGSAGAGKSTAAAYLAGQGFQIVKFAGAIKRMAIAMGLTQRHIEGDLKEVPCDLLLGKTPRYLMQTLGTEWGRDIMGKYFWINLWKNEVNSLPEGIPVVCDDCRFPNEAMALRDVGGKIVRIVRSVDNPLNNFTHESEKYQIEADHVVLNNGSFADLYRQLDGVFATNAA